MRLKEIQIKEAATAGATAAGNIAAVVNPHVANPSRKSVAYTGTPGVSGKGPVKQVKGGTYNTGKNALDMDVKLLSSKEPQMLRRQIQEGSLYKEQLNELWPAIAIGAGLVGAGVYGAKKLGKWMKKQQAAPSRTDVAIQQATDGMYSQNPKTKKTDEGLRIEPRGEEGKANAFKRAMANVAKNKETRAINTEKSKRQTAQAAGYDAIVGGKDVSQIAKG